MRWESRHHYASRTLGSGKTFQRGVKIPSLKYLPQAARSPPFERKKWMVWLRANTVYVLKDITKLNDAIIFRPLLCIALTLDDKETGVDHFIIPIYSHNQFPSKTIHFSDSSDNYLSIFPISNLLISTKPSQSSKKLIFMEFLSGAFQLRWSSWKTSKNTEVVFYW